MTYPKVAIIILNWNGKQDTIECLESLKHITYPNYEILLVDNGSTDGSVEYLKARYPGMEIIENGENLGFAEGNNMGIRRAMDEGMDYVLLLNNDTVVDKEFLGELVKVAEGDVRIGIVGPKVYNFSNDKIEFTGAKIQMWKGGFLNELKNITYNIYVDFISGSCMLIKNKVIYNVGLLDSTYFFSWEDTDFCMRTKRFGYYILGVPKSRMWHKVGASYGKYYADNPVVLREIIKNQLVFLSRYESPLQKITSIPFLILYYLYLIFKQNKNSKVRSIAIKNGLVDYINFRYRQRKKRLIYFNIY